MVLEEIAPGVDLGEFKKVTPANYRVSEDLCQMKGCELE
jgi:acyl CoA:acetate/3-ketoacid CoA transferase beta subunit